jgi:hypothetical protein
MDALVDDIGAHDGLRQLGCIDADEQEALVFSPGDEFVGEQAGMAEFDCEFVCPCFFEESFQG